MGATRPVAIPKHNNPSFPILYKTLIYPFAFYGLDIVLRDDLKLLSYLTLF